MERKLIKRFFCKNNLNLLICFLIGLYFFFMLFFDRKNLSIIINSTIVFIFLLSVIRVIIFKERNSFIALSFLAIIVLFTSVSNLINGIFSYNPLILCIIIYSIYSLMASSRNEFFFNILLFSIIIGYNFGIFFILIHYLPEIEKSFSIPANDTFFMNVDKLALHASELIGLSFCFFIITKSKKKIFLLPLLIVSIMNGGMCLVLAKRIGSIINTLCFLMLLLLITVYNKKRKYFYISIFVLAFLIVCFFTTIMTNPSFSRFKNAFFQIFNLEFIIEESTRTRVLMIYRDLDLLFKFPFFGLGEKGIMAFNGTMPHNGFGDIGVTYGFILFLSYFILMILTLYKSLRRYDFTISPFLLFVSVNGLFSFFYGMNFTSRSFNYLFGLALYFTLDDSKFYLRCLNAYPFKTRKLTGNYTYEGIEI